MRPVILVSGKDPLREEHGSGHSAYVRAHARAALRAGFEPHIVAIGAVTEDVTSEFGMIHRRATWLRPYRQLLIPVHAAPLERAIADIALSVPRAGSLLVHGFGVWSYAGVRAARRLTAAGTPVRSIVSSYTTHAAETSAIVAAVDAGAPVSSRIGFHAQNVWSTAVVQRYERAGYRGSRFVMVNYAAVGRLVHAAHGADIPLRISRYAAECAFEDAGAAARSPRVRAQPHIVTVTTHAPRKGVDVLIDALAELARDGVAFEATIVGGGDLLAAHRDLVRARGLEHVVTCTGFVDSVRPYLANADVFVLPSRSEQSGSLALLEALQAGLPIVASACDGIPEDIDDGVTGVLVLPGSSVALAAGLGRVLVDAALRERLAVHARSAFEERFSATAFAADLAAAYAEASA